MEGFKKVAIIIFGVIAVFLLAVIFYNANPANKCTKNVEEKIVQGDSLSGVLNDGDKIKILNGFYDCEEIKRDDTVTYSYKGNPNLLIKIVKGIPGDKFGFTKSGDGWNLLINGVVAVNSSGQQYILNQYGYQLLSMYEKDYRGVIPAGTYLLFGNLAAGSLDSSYFGLVGKENITGKAVK